MDSIVSQYQERIIVYGATHEDVFFSPKALVSQVKAKLRGQASGLYLCRSQLVDRKLELKEIEPTQSGVVQVAYNVNNPLDLANLQNILSAFGREIRNRDVLESFVDKRIKELEQESIDVNNITFNFNESWSPEKFQELDLKNELPLIESIKVDLIPAEIERSIDIDSFLDTRLSGFVGSNAPEEINGYFLNDVLRKNWDVIELVQSDVLNIVTMMLTGGQGSGKTHFANAIAEYLGWDIEIIHAPMIAAGDELWALRDMRDGKTLFTNTSVTNKLMENGNLVLFVEEANRFQNEGISNALLQFADGNAIYYRSHYDKKANEYRLVQEKFTGKALVVFARNVGGQYVGTNLTDAALMGRMMVAIDMPSPTKELISRIYHHKFDNVVDADLIESIVDVLVGFINETRSVVGDHEVGIRDGENVLYRLAGQKDISISDIRTMIESSIIAKFENRQVRNNLIGILHSTIS